MRKPGAPIDSSEWKWNSKLEAPGWYIANPEIVIAKEIANKQKEKKNFFNFVFFFLHEKSIFPQRNPHDAIWKKSEHAPPNGVSIGDCRSNLMVFIWTPHTEGLGLNSNPILIEICAIDWWILNEITWQIDRRNRDFRDNFSDDTAY